MTAKLWLRDDEWTEHAPCGDDIRFVTPPEELAPLDEWDVEQTCKACPVRPECIELNISPVRDFLKPKKVEHPSHSVWTAGVWLPEPRTRADYDALAELKAELAESLPEERAKRPDTLL